MKIAYVRISNILGLEEFEMSPGGTLTEISGDNGLGKTSILEAIKAGTQGGHDATLLRKGADKGEIVLVLDDGTELHKHVSATKSTLDLIKDGKKIPRPSDTIKGLTDLLSVNPVDFLTAPKKDRVKVLLEAMPIEVDPARLTEISGIPVDMQPGAHGLAMIEMVHKLVYEDRTGTNRAVKEKEATINQLTLAMPEAPGGVEGDEDALLQQIETLRAARDAETARIDTKLTGVRKDSSERTHAVKAEAQARIDAIKAECQAAIDAEVASLADIESKAGRVRQRAMDAFTEQAGPINETLAAIRTNRHAFAKREQTKATIAQMDTELEDLRADAERQTAALNGLDAYRSELLSSLPIPGLEVKDGEVLRDGVPFDRLNTAQQVDIAIEIAKLRAGDLAICCVDRFEALSPDTLAEFRERAAASNLQLIVTRVDRGDLTIRTQ
jgi:hypothetical protein